jgi:hypothetical protein
MITDSMFHALLLGGGFVGHQVLRSTWTYMSTVFGLGFKEGLAARMKAGHPLTPEEKHELDLRIRQKLIDSLQK